MNTKVKKISSTRAGRPKKEGIELDEVISFKTSSGNKLYYKRLAGIKGVSFSDFVRETMEKAHGTVSDFGNLTNINIGAKDTK